MDEQNMILSLLVELLITNQKVQFFSTYLSRFIVYESTQSEITFQSTAIANRIYYVAGVFRISIRNFPEFPSTCIL